MSDDNGQTVITIRLPDHLIERLYDVEHFVQDERLFTFQHTLSRSDLIRFFLLKGVEAYEEECEF